jgi:hypothetical protein
VASVGAAGAGCSCFWQPAMARETAKDSNSIWGLRIEDSGPERAAGGRPAGGRAGRISLPEGTAGL